MTPERAIIVGGGVGGMALAVAFTRMGWPFVLLERAPRLAEVGSGLGILPGAVRALESLGVGEELWRQGSRFQRFVLCTREGRDLSEVSFSRVFERAGRPGYVLHRGALHAALVRRAKPEALRTGCEVASLECRAGRARVELAGGSEGVEGDLLVGADGLHSVVRRHVLDDGPPRYAGETIFRGIADATLADPAVCRELFGDGRRAAFYALSEGRVYWWATAALAAGTCIPPAQRRDWLAARFAGWAHGIADLVAATPPERILQNDIFDRPPARRWHRDRAVLLGDAAHPTTPNLGQGACMAIEDAVVLAGCLSSAPDPETAFRRFHRARRRQTARTVRLSRWWGLAGLLNGPWAAARDAAIRLAPDAWMQRQAEAQYR